MWGGPGHDHYERSSQSSGTTPSLNPGLGLRRFDGDLAPGHLTPFVLAASTQTEAGRSNLVAPKKEELTPNFAISPRGMNALYEMVQRLAIHTSVLVLALRDAQAVPPADLDAALSGISDINAAMGRRTD